MNKASDCGFQRFAEIRSDIPIECLRHENVLGIQCRRNRKSCLRIKQLIHSRLWKLAKTNYSGPGLRPNFNDLSLAKFQIWNRKHLRRDFLRIAAYLEFETIALCAIEVARNDFGRESESVIRKLDRVPVKMPDFRSIRPMDEFRQSSSAESI